MWNRKEQTPTENIPRIVEGHEKAACGMEIDYKVDLNTGLVTENNIANMGTGKKTKHCARCQWRTICMPTPVRVEDITKEIDGIQAYIDELKADARMGEVKAKIFLHYDEIKNHYEEINRQHEEILNHYNSIVNLFDEAKDIREKDFNDIQKVIDEMRAHLQMVPENEL